MAAATEEKLDETELDAAQGAIAKTEDEGHDDLTLSAEEVAEEAAEAAANRERELGGSTEAVQDVYDRTYKQALEDAQEARERQAELEAEQAALDAEGGAGGAAASDGKAASVREEAGEPVGEMPPGEPQSTDVPPEKLAVTGTSSAKRKWNGKAPGMTWLTLKAVKIEVPEGDFKKGERITFEGEAVIVSEAAKDKLDKDTKTAVEAEQLHDAVVVDFALTDGMSD